METAKQYKLWLIALVGTLIIAGGLLVAKNWYKPAAPKIQEQPTDTRVAEKFFQLHHWVDKSDIDVYFVPTEDPPIVDILLTFDAGAARDGVLSGISKLTADILSEGTVKLDADAIADEFSNIGARYEVVHDSDFVAFKLRSLADKKKLARAVNLFAEVIATPKFPQAGIDRIKQRMLTDLAQEANDPSSVAYKHFLQSVYGAHPYANIITGKAEDINKITQSDVKEFYDKFYVSKNATISVVGSIHRDLAKDIGQKIAAVLKQGNAATKLEAVNLLPKMVEDRIKFPSQQAHVFLGQAGRIAGDADYFPLEVGNHILGGDPESALFQEIRESRSLAYSVYSSFKGMRELGPFFMNLQTEGSKTEEAIGVLKQMLANFMRNGPTEERLQAAKDNLIGAFPLKFASNREIISVVGRMAIYKLPYTFFDNYVDSINKVTIDDIKTAFNKKLQPERMALVVVGGQEG